MKSLEVLFTPADFAGLKDHDLSGSVCVVFDVLRATSTMVTALANGAAVILPVAEIAEALDVRRREPQVLLAGERDGVLIPASVTGSVAFDLGNSPREFTREKVAGRTIVMTTTNGTRALRACAKAREVLVCSFLNLSATASFLGKEQPERLLLVCSGTYEEAAYEDVLGAGALCQLVWEGYEGGAVADSAHMALRLFRMEEQDLAGALSRSRNGRRLLERSELREDVAFCARQDVMPLVVRSGHDGRVRAT
jgi:2-phosphosulfolactate phosphatase